MCVHALGPVETRRVIANAIDTAYADATAIVRTVYAIANGWAVWM